MNRFHQLFGCNTKEELYMKVKNKDVQVSALIDFMEYAKANIRIKNQAIVNAITLIKYANSIDMPNENMSTIIFIDTKNVPVLFRKTRIDFEDDIKKALKEGIIAGGTNIFIIHSDRSSYEKIERIQNLFKKLNISTIDTLAYSEEDGSMYSFKGKKFYHAAGMFETINEENYKYIKDDFSVFKEYAEFSSYYAKNKILGLNIINNTNDIKEKLKIGYQHHNQEIFGLIAYDNNHNIIAMEELFKGGINVSIVDVKIIAKYLFQLENVKGAAVFHNHPSGNPTPSKEDLVMTKRISNMCKALDVEFLDHYIVGKERTLSFSIDVDEFQSKNSDYQNKVDTIKNIKDVAKTSFSDFNEHLDKQESDWDLEL